MFKFSNIFKIIKTILSTILLFLLTIIILNCDVKANDSGQNKKTKLEILLQIDSLRYYQGQHFNLYTTIRNNSDDTVRISDESLGYNFFDLQNNQFIPITIGGPNIYIIKPHSDLILPYTKTFAFGRYQKSGGFSPPILLKSDVMLKNRKFICHHLFSHSTLFIL